MRGALTSLPATPWFSFVTGGPGGVGWSTPFCKLQRRVGGPHRPQRGLWRREAKRSMCCPGHLLPSEVPCEPSIPTLVCCVWAGTLPPLHLLGLAYTAPRRLWLDAFVSSIPLAFKRRYGPCPRLLPEDSVCCSQSSSAPLPGSLDYGCDMTLGAR